MPQPSARSPTGTVNLYGVSSSVTDSTAGSATINNLTVNQTNVDAILNDTGTSGVVLAADAITAAKIADDAISSEHLNTGALTADAFAADALVAATFATGAFTADAFAADSIVAATFATGAIAADAVAATALDNITATDPAGLATTFPEMVVATWRDIYMGTKLTSTQLLHYKDDGTTVETTQTVADSGSVQTVSAAS